jgi:flavorubredoxin
VARLLKVALYIKIEELLQPLRERTRRCSLFGKKGWSSERMILLKPMFSEMGLQRVGKVIGLFLPTCHK